MESDNQKLQKLKEKKARLLMQLEMLTSVSDSFYLQLGTVVAQIHFLEKKLLQINYDESQL